MTSVYVCNVNVLFSSLHQQQQQYQRHWKSYFSIPFLLSLEDNAPSHTLKAYHIERAKSTYYMQAHAHTLRANRICVFMFGLSNTISFILYERFFDSLSLSLSRTLSLSAIFFLLIPDFIHLSCFVAIVVVCVCGVQIYCTQTIQLNQ